MDELPADQRAQIVDSSQLADKYATVLAPDSAYEKLLAKVAREPEPERGPAPRPAAEAPQRRPKQEESMLDNPAVRSFARAAPTAAGREIMRSIFGTARRRR